MKRSPWLRAWSWTDAWTGAILGYGAGWASAGIAYWVLM